MAKSIEELLERCVFRVECGAEVGTAFAVSDRRLFTCGHVVEDADLGDEVVLQPADGADARTARLVARWPDSPGADGTLWPDLAVLEVDGGERLPMAMMLDVAMPEPEDRLLVGGFPENQRGSVDYQPLYFEAGSSTGRNLQERQRYGQIEGGSVDHGMSGGPVVDDAGFVCGYVRYTKKEESRQGGFYVPFGEVARELPQIDSLCERPDPAAQPWITRLSANTLKQRDRDEYGMRLGHEAPSVMVNLQIVETERKADSVSSWQISARGRNLVAARTLGDLGEGVLEALNHWGQRSQLTTSDEVRLLGRLLGSALLPAPIKEYVDGIDRREPRLMRLRMDSSDELLGIPWEYATDLATSPDIAFSRYVPIRKPRLARRNELRVLVVINSVLGDAASLQSQMEAALDRPRVTAEVMRDVSFADFAALLRPGAGWDIVHLITQAWSDGALGFPYSWQEIDPTAWAEVAESLAASEAKTVVLQLYTAYGDPAPPLSVFLPLFDTRDPDDAGRDAGAVDASEPDDDTPDVEVADAGEIRALVVEQHASTSSHVIRFTEAFYQEVATGESVERSVQVARKRMAGWQASSGRRELVDPAAFGAVAVVTTAEGDIRLLRRVEAHRGSRRGDIKSDRGRGDSRNWLDATPAEHGRARYAEEEKGGRSPRR